METTPVVVTSHFLYDGSLLEASEKLAQMLVDPNVWGQPQYTTHHHPYIFSEMWITNVSRQPGSTIYLDQYNPQNARHQIREQDPTGVCLEFAGGWRNAYVLNEDVIEGYGVTVEVIRLDLDEPLFEVQIILDDSRRWFSVGRLEFVEDEQSGSVTFWTGQGYILPESTATQTPSRRGYHPRREITQWNRQIVLHGILHYITAFQPHWVTLSYSRPMICHKSVLIVHPEIIAESLIQLQKPLLCYTTDGVEVSPGLLKQFATDFFSQTLEGIPLLLEAPHYGFVQTLPADSLNM